MKEGKECKKHKISNAALSWLKSEGAKVKGEEESEAKQC